LSEILERNLMALGLSEYESRTWLALLRDHPVTAYEAARKSGVPTAKVYGVLDRLLEKGMVLELEEEGKKRYVPRDPADFIALERQKSGELLDTLERDLKSWGTASDVSYVWNISGYGAFLERAEALIRAARRSVLISVWKEELAPLIPLLRQREGEGIPVAVVHFGSPAERVGTLFEHPIADTLYEEKGGRGFALVADGEAALMGTVTSGYRVEGAWSAGRGFVTLAEDYIKHDIYIMKIVSRFDGELISKFGEGYSLLRDIFSDREV
jgi:sugar-specific transcriptional regulator TrmB